MIDGVITLIAKAYAKNEDKAIVETESTREVFCEVQSVGRNDFYSAAQAGMALEFVFITNPINYAGEQELEYDGNRYAITRTYHASQDRLEIYAGVKVGLNGSYEPDKPNTD